MWCLADELVLYSNDSFSFNDKKYSIDGMDIVQIKQASGNSKAVELLLKHKEGRVNDY